ncbi:MAG TPA: hypothetical protein DIU00_22465 [Phycisphaerales bacterium]|nr:hypothetical protein [Phycisphaerales bacterium]
MNPEMRAQIRDVDLGQIQEQFRGAEYRKLVQQHLRKVGVLLELALSGAGEALTDQERNVAEVLIDEYNRMGYNSAFWHRDLGDVFQEICNRFAELMSQVGTTADDKVKFNVFQIITMNFALQARDQKELRKFAGIRRSLLFR